MAVTYYGGGQYAYSNVNFVGYTEPSTPQSSGRQQVNTRTKTVRVKAGFLGQVVVQTGGSGLVPEEVIVWESSPKKTLHKADKAAQKAQLRAVERSFA